jgi:hypothetical protein
MAGQEDEEARMTKRKCGVAGGGWAWIEEEEALYR